MAATLPRILSFGKNTKALLNSMKLSVVPVQQYSVPVSNYGEKVTHTGQVRHSVTVFKGFNPRLFIVLAFVVRIDSQILLLMIGSAVVCAFNGN